jgi:hypothetical protein
MTGKTLKINQQAGKMNQIYGKCFNKDDDGNDDLLLQLDFRSPAGYDRTRGVEIGNKNFKLTHLEEAYTSEHWLVRIYKVKDLDNRQKVAKPTIPAQKWKKRTSKKVRE